MSYLIEGCCFWPILDQHKKAYGIYLFWDTKIPVNILWPTTTPRFCRHLVTLAVMFLSRVKNMLHSSVILILLTQMTQVIPSYTFSNCIRIQ